MKEILIIVLMIAAVPVWMWTTRVLASDDSPATERQLQYLSQLCRGRDEDVNELSIYDKSIAELSKKEASDAIATLEDGDYGILTKSGRG